MPLQTAFKLADRDGDGQLNFQEYFEFQNPEESDNDKLKYHVIKQDIHLRCALHCIFFRGGGISHLSTEGFSWTMLHYQKYCAVTAPNTVVTSCRDDDEDKELSFDEFHAGYWSSFFIWEVCGIVPIKLYDGCNRNGDPPKMDLPHMELMLKRVRVTYCLDPACLQEEREKFDEEKDQEKARMKFIELDTDGNNFLNAKELIAAFADLHPSERRYARLQSEHMMDMADENGDRKLTLKEALKNAHAFYSFTNDDDDYNYHDEL